MVRHPPRFRIRYHDVWCSAGWDHMAHHLVQFTAEVGVWLGDEVDCPHRRDPRNDWILLHEDPATTSTSGTVLSL